MKKQIFLICLGTSLASSAFSQNFNIEISPDEVVPVCAVAPELCTTNSFQILSNGEDETVVPICAIFPQLCVPEPDYDLEDNNRDGVGIVMQEGAELPEGAILVDPQKALIGDGVMIIPLENSSD